MKVGRHKFGVLTGLTASAAVLLVVGAPASAATRFAEPNGDGPSGLNQCLATNPCSIQSAVEDAAVFAGDVVILTPGTTGGVYEDQGANILTVDDAITLQGEAGQPRPVIPSSALNGIIVSTTATVRDLQVNYTGNPGIGLQTDLPSGTATVERVIVNSTAGGFACAPFDAVLRDSICRTTVNGIDAIDLTATGDLTSATTLRNVTAIAEGSASAAISVTANSFADLTVNARNTIASGGIPANFGADVEAQTNSAPSTTAVVDLSFSNYDTQTATGTGASVTDPNSQNNQTAAPLFVNAAGGNFHQAAGTPTIDAGAADGFSGSSDLDGEPRNQGCAPDIGADEFVGECPPAPEPQSGDTAPPDTQITKQPKRKTKQKAATFEFSSTEPGSTFECTLDDGPFEPCTSPLTVKGKKGKNQFEVRAKDAAGNVDATPATFDWKVKKKKKK